MSKKYYHLGDKEGLFIPGTQPDGWELGRTDKVRNLLSESKLGDKNPMKRKEVSQKVGDAQRGEKSWKYGTHESLEAKKKNSESHLGDKNAMKSREVSRKVAEKLRGKPTWNKGLTKSTSDSVLRGAKNSYVSRCKFYADNKGNHEYWDPIVSKRFDSIRHNGSGTKSKMEDDSYLLLLTKIAEDDVIRWWDKDKRYPFACDLYIKSKDLFIELNYHWTHGGHRYDSTNAEDAAIANSLKNSDSEYDNAAYNTWVVRDINKYNVAENNKINYLTFYDYESFEQFVESL